MKKRSKKEEEEEEKKMEDVIYIFENRKNRKIKIENPIKQLYIYFIWKLSKCKEMLSCNIHSLPIASQQLLLISRHPQSNIFLSALHRQPFLPLIFSKFFFNMENNSFRPPRGLSAIIKRKWKSQCGHLLKSQGLITQRRMRILKFYCLDFPPCTHMRKKIF